MKDNPNKAIRDKGLQDRQIVMDLIKAGAYKNYQRNSNVPESQLTNADLAAQNVSKNTSAFTAPYLGGADELATGSNQNAMAAGPWLPSFERAAESFAMSQNALYKPSTGIGPSQDQQLYNKALASMDLSLQEYQKSLPDRLAKKIKERNPNIVTR